VLRVAPRASGAGAAGAVLTAARLAAAGWGILGGARGSPAPHLHLPRVLVSLALHAPQLRHALLQVGRSVAVLHLVVLAAVLG
jgi:hypothetical protein